VNEALIKIRELETPGIGVGKTRRRRAWSQEDGAMKEDHVGTTREKVEPVVVMREMKRSDVDAVRSLQVRPHIPSPGDSQLNAIEMNRTRIYH